MIDLNSKGKGSYTSSSSTKWDMTREKMGYGSLRNMLASETKASKKSPSADYVTQPIIMQTRQMANSTDDGNDTAVRKIRNKFEDIKTKSRKLFSSNYPHTQRIMNELTDTSTTSMASDYNYSGLDKVAKWSKNSLSSSSVTSLNDSSKFSAANILNKSTTSKSMQLESGSSMFFNVRPSSTFRSDEDIIAEHLIKKQPTPIPEMNENFLDTNRLFTKQNTNFSIKLNYDHLIHREDGASTPHNYADLNTGRFQRENTVKNLVNFLMISLLVSKFRNVFI